MRIVDYALISKIEAARICARNEIQFYSSGLGASLKCSYLPSNLPRKTVKGMIKRFTKSGMTSKSYSLRYRVIK